MQMKCYNIKVFVRCLKISRIRSSSSMLWSGCSWGIVYKYILDRMPFSQTVLPCVCRRKEIIYTRLIACTSVSHLIDTRTSQCLHVEWSNVHSRNFISKSVECTTQNATTPYNAYNIISEQSPPIFSFRSSLFSFFSTQAVIWFPCSATNASLATVNLSETTSHKSIRSFNPFSKASTAVVPSTQIVSTNPATNH